MTKDELFKLIQVKEAELDLLKKKLREIIYASEKNIQSRCS